MTDTAALLAEASDHLHHAAAAAEQCDPALAGQIRLAAATLPADPWQQGRDDDGGDVSEHLALALDCLDQIPPLSGPADLQLCAWHVHELRRSALSGVAS